MAAPLIETKRLLLRQWRPDDKNAFAHLNADPVVMRHFPCTLSHPESDAMVDRMSSELSQHGWGLLATEVIETGRMIGFVGLSSPGWEASFTPCVEIGWRLERGAWGHGYAPEAASAVLEFAFTQVELPNDEVVSFTTEANIDSRRVMDKIGLQHDPARDFDHPTLPTWSGRRDVLSAIDRTGWMRSTLRPD